MIKGLLLIITLLGLIAFNWDKVPQPVKKVLGGLKTVFEEVYEHGKDMPDPVKKYVDTSITPKAKEIKDKILE